MTKRTTGAEKSAPRRSGPSLTDERRAELGYGRLTLRLPQAALDALNAESTRTGVSRSRILELAILGVCPVDSTGE